MLPYRRANSECRQEYPKYTPSPITTHTAKRTHVCQCREVMSQSEKTTPTASTTGIPGVRKVRGNSGFR